MSANERSGAGFGRVTLLETELRCVLRFRLELTTVRGLDFVTVLFTEDLGAGVRDGVAVTLVDDLPLEATLDLDVVAVVAVGRVVVL